MRSGRVFKVDMCSMWTLFKMDVVQDGSVFKWTDICCDELLQ